MRFIWRHIEEIVSSYRGALPLSHFLKQYFRERPQLGSRDRKLLSEMSYCWYRYGKAFGEIAGLQEKIQACLLLGDASLPHLPDLLPESWRSVRSAPVAERIRWLKEQENIGFDTGRMLPFEMFFSEGITREEWLESMLRQPAMFIRLIKDKARVISLLQERGIDFLSHTYTYQRSDHKDPLHSLCLSLPNGSALDKILDPSSYVIQDASSQGTGQYFSPGTGEEWWDCCSGAGGKSLLLRQICPPVQLTVSDKRKSILHNLAARFRQYRLPLPEVRPADVADGKALASIMENRKFDAIICDAPCSGSGTWARTPEQLHFFTQEKLKDFSRLQKQIAFNAADYLKPGGRLIYITCSVFREENESVVEDLVSRGGLQLSTQTLINGISKHADSMYIAVLAREA